MDHVEDGFAVYTEKPAWHAKGEVKPLAEAKAMTPQEYVGLKHGYDIVAVPVEITLPSGKSIVMPDQFNLIRDKDECVISRHTVGEGYRPFVPVEIARLVLDPFYAAGLGYMDACFGMYPGDTMEVQNTDGSTTLAKFRGARSVYMSLRLAIEVIAPGDTKPTEIYLGIQDFTGGGKLRGRQTGRRAECHNGVTAVFSGGFDFSISHNMTGEQQLAMMAKNWDSAKEAVGVYQQRVDILATCRINVPQVIEQLLGLDKKPVNEWTSGDKRTREAWIAASNDSEHGTIGQSAWDVYNGWTFLASHGKPGSRSKKDDADRFVATLTGEAGRRERQIFNHLMELAGGE